MNRALKSRSRSSLYLLVIVVTISIGVVVVDQTRNKPPLPTSSTLSGAFARVKPGMSEKDVQSLLGTPIEKSVNRKFENKTDQDWTKIVSDVRRPESDPSSNSSAPDPQVLREGAELSHRYHDIWSYYPSPQEVVTIYFDKNREVLQLNASKLTNASKHSQ
jgi:outer membrane protein assembly factor BamE (lipoprotein component of BamABCDE complex)